MSDGLAGQVAVVTGGAVRLGRAISLALAEAGCHVFIHYGRSAGPAAETAAAAAAFGVESGTFSANLARAEETAGIIPAAVEALGKVDILINSAAVFEAGGLAETTVDQWEREMAINLRAPFFLSQAFAEQLAPGREGQIVNVTDARVLRPGRDHLAYRLTKAGLVTLTRALALELAPRVRVNAVALGAILPPPGEDEAYLQQLAQERVPLRRAGSAEVVVANVLHLLRQPFLTGVILPVDGGEFL
ncbi:MAG: SDR family oxidoreductase [Anaerolineae bacterium]|nr:SDR family oxidoreductase [Anaerolineae bacterium]